MITLPRGLAFAHKGSTLRKGLSVTLGSAKLPFTISGGAGTLTLHLLTPQSGALISIGMPAIIESQSLRAKIRAGKVRHVMLTLTVIDAHGSSTRLATTLKVLMRARRPRPAGRGSPPRRFLAHAPPESSRLAA